MNNKIEIDCGAVLDIAVVALWWEQTRATLQTASAIQLKADELQRIDAAGLQALLVLFIAARKHEVPIQWSGPSDVLQHAATLTGLNKHLLLAC